MKRKDTPPLRADSTKHTPGPWTIIGVDGFASGIWGPDAEDVVPDGSSMRQADARLIAAAPDLLEALEDFVAFYEEFLGRDSEDLQKTRQYHGAKAAIAKARGGK